MRFAFRRNAGSLYVPPADDAPRRAQRCEAGHVFSREVAACPVCAAARAQKQTRAEVARIRSEMSGPARQRAHVAAESKRRSDRAGKLRAQREKLIERLAAVEREIAELGS